MRRTATVTGSSRFGKCGVNQLIFSIPTADESISQGDILDTCPIFGLEASNPIDLGSAPSRWQERVIVLTQACDLAQVKTTKVLIAVVHSAQKLVDQGILKASTVRDQVRRWLVYGWYFLPSAHHSPQLPESIIDLHDLHTVPRAIDRRRQTSLPIGIPVSRTLGTALRCNLYANRIACSFRN
jgi:hypothetical protein